MSSFLVNLAKRGAGLPVTTIQAPLPSPFRPEIRDTFTEADESAPIFRKAEGFAIGNTASPPPLPTSSFEGYRELPEAPTYHVLSTQPLSRAESSTSIQSMVGESEATAHTPLHGPTPMSLGRVSLDKGETEGTSLKSPKPLASGDRPIHANRAVITEIDVEKRLQSLAPMERSSQQTRDGAQKLREPALASPTIHPVPAESHRFLQFPKATPASSTAPPAQLPIHVRIGRVEVRAATAPTPTPARPNPPAPLGFEGYHRVRNYRS